MSIIGEAILAISVEMLVKKLASAAMAQFARREQIEADLRKWERILFKIHAVLDDAEEQQMTKQSVKLWLGELKNLAYDVEDILDEFSTEALRRQLLVEEEEQQQQQQQQPQASHHEATGATSKSMLRKLIPGCCRRPPPLIFNSRMKPKIDEITSRLQEIVTEKEHLNLKETSSSSSSRGRFKRAVKERLPTTSLVNEAEVHGRDDDKKVLVDLLLHDDLSGNGGGTGSGGDGLYGVIPIVGMGGLGKTTLAQLVYNEKVVESHFDVKAWVCVSEDFDAIKVTKAILRTVSVHSGDDDDLNSLQVKLKDGLLRRKFLLVLDDVWNENYGDWTNLRLPFLAGSPGSKIIVTTRNQSVASMMGTVSAYELKKLSDDDCRIVFTQHSLDAKDFNKHQQLKDIGEEILKKCNGLPLAAKTLGGLLRGKYDPLEWKKVLSNKIWNLPEEGSGIMRALKVSYYYLPAHLKQCFAYCSLLTKDTHFLENEIVLIWMAEGLLEPDTSGMKMEELGLNYFKELHSRSFFQKSYMDSRFVMHDLITDLARWAASDLFFTLEDTLEASKQQTFPKNLRHFSYPIGHFDHIRRFETISGCKQLRTFVSVQWTFSRHFLSDSVVHMLLKLRRLRVLCLREYNISKISNSIGDLKHLRHLDLSETLIESLPESINTLYNLHTLLLESCYRLKRMCTDMGNLIKLRHLNNYNVPLLEGMPLRMGKLYFLHTLPYFVVGKNIGSRLREFKFLENLQGKLKISRLENVEDTGDVRDAQLNGKKNLGVLFLEWTKRNGSSRKPETENHVLDLLRPHENLQQLAIRGYGGTKFPFWLGDSAFSNLVLLRFENCDMCTFLPSLGQLPALKHLSIIGMTLLISTGLEFYGDSGSMSFPLLETLFFGEMPRWEEWIPRPSSQEDEVFPQLKELSLVKCSKLRGRLPLSLPSLERLVIQECEQLQVSVPSTPTLTKLEIGGCKKVTWRSTNLSSPNPVVSSNLPNQLCLTGFKQELPTLQELSICNTNELKHLWQTGSELVEDISFLRSLEIGNCPQVLSLVAEEEDIQQGFPCRLKHMELRSCPSLVKLPQAFLSLSSLSQLKISECHALESFPEALMHNGNAPLESLTVVECNSLTYIVKVQLPSSLKLLHVRSCRKLRTLVGEDQISGTENKGIISSGCSRHVCLLEQLHVEDCPSLTALLSKGKLPATLEDIKVKNCSKLPFLSTGSALPKALKNLYICECSELESVVEGLVSNSSLETIYIWGCPVLKVLPNDLHKALHLRELTIYRCQSLVSFPEGGLSASKKLTKLELTGCEKLKALPNSLRIFTSLDLLLLQDCPSLESFTADCFPKNISALGIDYLTVHKPFLEWGLHRFNSLTELRLYGGCEDVVAFPPKETKMVLPATITFLWIDNFPNLLHLSSIVTLTALRSLRFSNCPKLQYLPENGLPTSLLRLQIIQCPVMKERCKKDKGQYWPLISDLPCVEIDFICIFDPLN